uniref:Uncharacterized protein n=1 Tax=Arundo donax TaxID=35708 RepID=A0A0A8ZW69_ARUDO
MLPFPMIFSDFLFCHPQKSNHLCPKVAIQSVNYFIICQHDVC